MDLRWRDEFLVWNPDHYDGLRTISLPSKNVWTPVSAVHIHTFIGMLKLQDIFKQT
jgi:hypothetical protein